MKRLQHIHFLLFFAAAVILATPLTTAAESATEADFVPLVNDLPTVVEDSRDLPSLLNGLFQLTIAAAAILAVIMISIGGFKYMMSESIFDKGDARSQITEALIGLGIVLASVLILQLINPDLVSLDIFRNAEPAPASSTSGADTTE